MVYKIVMYVDGGCRGNGQPGAYGACACNVVKKWGRSETFTRRLPSTSSTTPTSQRAELSAIILALEQAIETRRELDSNPYMDVTIYTDSKYAHGCMTKWYSKWQNNGFINSAGFPVANRDLIEEALGLESDVLNHGDVNWEWIPRCDNTVADRAVNDEMDEMEGPQRYSSPEGYSSSEEECY